ncbi:MAG: hypothetical protein LQ342_003978 [Letrouitia transgressa]|nr:MAG: hypothetical protein LQ342_003978 [Letrouitia transgressa]
MAQLYSSTGYPFATIIPQGSDAERALDPVADDANLHQWHRSFISVQRKAPPAESGSDLSESERPTTAKEFWSGHYIFRLSNLPLKPTSIGWRIGRGSSKLEADRGVDILLIRPRKKTEGVATVHARIQFHPLSGVLMLVGVEDEKPIQYRVHDSNHPTMLRQGQKHVLYQKTNSFTLGNLQYTFVFEDLTQEKYAEFIKRRNILFEDLGHQAPHPALSAIPRQQDVKRGPVITHGTLAFGKFGWVYSGVNAATGDPLAVKEHRPKNVQEQRIIDNEIDIGMAECELLIPALDNLNDRDPGVGLLRTNLEWCEHQNHKPCGRIPESIFTASLLARCDFYHFPWSEAPLARILEFYRGPLVGLAFLHTHGYMHRDVHGGNLFVVSVDPPRSVLGDFGKAMKGLSANFSHLGPVHTVAPEVDGKSNYSELIDIWSLGFSLFGVILSKYQAEKVVKGERITKELHDWATECLRIYSRQGTLEAQVAELLKLMLAWDPKKRILAVKILERTCLNKVISPPSPPSPYSSTTHPQPSSAHLSPPRTHRNSPRDESVSSTDVASEISSSQGPTGVSMLEFHVEKRRKATAEKPDPPLLRRR